MHIKKSTRRKKSLYIVLFTYFFLVKLWLKRIFEKKLIEHLNIIDTPLHYSTVMQPIPTLSSPMQLNDAHTKMLAQSSIMFRPYNHFPTTITPTLNALNSSEPRVSAFKVVGKRPKTVDISSEIPLKLCRTETNHYNTLDLSKLISPINGNYIGDAKSLSMPNSYDSTTLSGELNGLCPLNLKKNNTLNHETVTHSKCDNYDMAYDLTTTQHQQPKIHNSYQTDANLNKPVIQYRYTAQGNLVAINFTLL